MPEWAVNTITIAGPGGALLIIITACTIAIFNRVVKPALTDFRAIGDAMVTATQNAKDAAVLSKETATQQANAAEAFKILRDLQERYVEGDFRKR